MNEIQQTSIYNRIKQTVYSQDFQQKLNMCISVSLELYRVMISSLLVVFVPQNCDGQVCELMENYNSSDIRYTIALGSNYITMISFMLLYMCEIRREEKLIKILEVNKTISTDNESVGKRLDLFDEKKRKQLFDIDRHYKYISYYVMCLYSINTTLSGVVINDYSLGNQTMVIFLTNILFMISKLSNVYNIINTEKNIFYSAYLNTKVQFNDIDPHEEVKIERRKSLEQNVKKIEESRGFCLLEKERLKLMEDGGFFIQDSSDSE